ncbi:MAG TPA: site-specific DNA-methyltransferase [Candidatus Woesebacteria bacterium]|nr:site-specific DNA-methyltransferase [Candidatus Woesebacteria bacterium]
MNKINIQSHDLHVEKLKALKSAMPQLFSEDGVLDTKELELLTKGYPSNSAGKYEFNWAGKMSAKRNAYKPSRAKLKPDRARSIEFDSTKNLIIEGDNLEVLKLLQKSYSNKVKCIYIDPPYNTGNDFVYTDDFSEDKKAYWEKSGTTDNGVKVDSNTESQGRYHSNWLNMMYPRLVLARELLKDDGVIFVSIDDNEVHNLRKIMEEVFGEENFVSTIVLQNNPKGRYLDKNISTSHEYILIFSKSELTGNHLSVEKSKEEVKNNFHYNDEGGAYRLLELRNTHREFGKHNRPNLHYPIFYNTQNQTISTKESEEAVVINPIWEDGHLGCWTWGKSKVEKEKDQLVCKQVNDVWKVYRKSYAKDVKTQLKSLWIDRKYHTEVGQEAFNSILETKEKVFQSPKPVDIIKLAVKMSTSEDDYILDFFAGSGTTAQAVIELNKEDNGNRKYILVQLPELTKETSEAHKAGFNTISDITIERVKRVSEKVQKEGKHLDLGFKVFKLAPSFFPENQFTPNPEKTEKEHLQDLNEYLEKAKSQMKFEFDEEELMFEILLKDGFKLNFSKEQIKEIGKNKVYKITDGEKEALICLDDTIDDSTLKIQEEMKDMRFICLERAVDTTKKWNLKSIFGQNLWVA